MFSRKVQTSESVADLDPLVPKPDATTVSVAIDELA